MIFLLSPAKKIVCEGLQSRFPVSTPVHIEEASYLVSKLKSKSALSLKRMMHISDDLANLNRDRFQKWTASPDDNESMQAVLLFQGDVYQGLQANKWSKKNMGYAQKNLKILSGLYGILRPTDQVMPYRLEMGSDFKVTAAKSNLYKYWGDTIQKALEAEVGAENLIINLASNEYAKAAKLNKTGAQVITPEFRDFHNGQYKMISFFAKKARGLMVNYAVQNNIEKVEELKSFDSEGYIFNNKLSKGEKWVFTRDQR